MGTHFRDCPSSYGRGYIMIENKQTQCWDCKGTKKVEYYNAPEGVPEDVRVEKDDPFPADESY